MFKKILIAEDHESANISVQRTLEELNISKVDYAYYCDDALGKIQKSIREKEPYDLMITDLEYEEDHREQHIKNGQELIEEVRKLQPALKVIVFSAEHKSGVIDSLFTKSGINGYVRKARNDSKELKKAITAVAQNENYLSLDLKQEIKKLNSYEFSDYDITLVSLISQGVLQKNIPVYLQKNHITPNSLSSIEKRLNALKEALQVNSNEQLVAFCKDLGII
ncbi:MULTISPECIES: response regulator [Chryseobacterium]|uniref:Two-component system capsular synthesis response regulator RcsB n=1 Tax=Chryseobacterium camelliae TaxID=1265445 RepID=A0ABU0TMS7_9FLAO|nr:MULTISPECIES: response regulator [Chryseobacterium]MDQ1098301.1 two-component system capsular synthesis response regulator RcsB [Chryseobacterium camelliae]MDQ1102227.1 two-component system capsular synthesis response regulator RcsB [Chryseobacterium sp. SORGH_AS_1048]MDR6130032.1 two-component system capsular synthesis response regulator RcsB [Chryseobacterium sp. SORGH_AS_1175]MDT3407844.1 two-component system capsular synthesis response regulator RcsB [Pseudacidovorax intermedius]